MSYLEDLRDGYCTIQQASRENYDDIIEAVSEFRNGRIDAWKTVTLDDFITFADSHPVLDHVSFEELKELLKLDQTVESKRKKDSMRKITNKALIKQLSIEMVRDEDDVRLLPKTNNAYYDIEDANDKYYQYLWDLGYRGEEIEGLPKSVRGNFRLFQEKQIIKKEITSIIEMKSRFEYFLKESKRNPSYYNKENGIREAFEDYQVGMIRSFLGKSQSIEQEMRGVKQEKFEQFFDHTLKNRLARRNHKDYEYKEVDQLLEDIQWERITPTEKTYAKLFDLEFDHLSSKGTEIAKSGSKQYVDLCIWKEVRNHFMEQAYVLFLETNKNKKANEYLSSRYIGNVDPNPNPVTAVLTYLWERNIRNRERKGKEVPEDEKKKLHEIQASENNKLKRILPESMWKER